jgi:hypothetical protein
MEFALSNRNVLSTRRQAPTGIFLKTALIANFGIRLKAGPRRLVLLPELLMRINSKRRASQRAFVLLKTLSIH